MTGRISFCILLVLWFTKFLPLVCQFIVLLTLYIELDYVRPKVEMSEHFGICSDILSEQYKLVKLLILLVAFSAPSSIITDDHIPMSVITSLGHSCSVLYLPGHCRADC